MSILIKYVFMHYMFAYNGEIIFRQISNFYVISRFCLCPIQLQSSILIQQKKTKHNSLKSKHLNVQKLLFKMMYHSWLSILKVNIYKYIQKHLIVGFSAQSHWYPTRATRMSTSLNRKIKQYTHMYYKNRQVFNIYSLVLIPTTRRL